MPLPPLITQTRVTRIANKWHCRLYVNGELRDEMACVYQQDIGWCCRQMLRWFDKTTVGNAHSSNARTRILRDPHGRVWYRHQLKQKSSSYSPTQKNHESTT